MQEVLWLWRELDTDERRSHEELGVKLRRAGGQGRAEGGGGAGGEKVKEVKPGGGGHLNSSSCHPSVRSLTMDV